MDHAHAVLDYWFGPLPLTAAELAKRMQFWFGGQEPVEVQKARDEEIRDRLGALAARAAAGTLASWADSPRRRLALILLLDQVPRNIHRGTPQAFAQDRQALSLALSGMQLGADAALEPVERIFFYLPLEHAESSEVQEESVAAYRRLLAEAPPELRSTFESTLRSAEQHRALIGQFGRFPERNQALGRPTTPEERAWLRAGTPRLGS